MTGTLNTNVVGSEIAADDLDTLLAGIEIEETQEELPREWCGGPRAPRPPARL
ncbi:hypothetical protein [Methylobacterium sp. WSM2598]|uniref:hypothetical protein n=1 Tax=Methylobacterium sp. WSM2598 TaxID=398261 RepID=UPI00035F097A|nr:hypothetical protein [Methylobacterium sp. WSM2598]